MNKTLQTILIVLAVIVGFGCLGVLTLGVLGIGATLAYDHGYALQSPLVVPGDGQVQPVEQNPAAADVPSGGPSVTSSESRVCGMTTEQAKEVLSLDVQRLGTESCSWVFRVPEGGSIFSANLPADWVVTITEQNGDVKVYAGDRNLVVKGWAGTFRYAPGFPGDDAVNIPCDILSKEKAFGVSEVPSFEVTAGNFTCR